MARVQGVVKWFSNQKGYGFIEPTSKDADTKEDIFVHQSSVTSDGYRSLVEGWIVEFDIVNDADGKLKADNVTAPGGGPCTGPRRPRREKKPEKKPEKAEKSTKKKNGAASTKKQAEVPWHVVLSQEVKKALTAKGIRHSTGTVDVSIGKQRIKLGTRGYVSMASADGILAEGTFTSDENGAVALVWKHALKCEGGAWAGSSKDDLMSSLNLTDDSIKAVGPEETPATLWGEDKPDPKDALEAAGFQMRRVVLTPKARVQPLKE